MPKPSSKRNLALARHGLPAGRTLRPPSYRAIRVGRRGSVEESRRGIGVSPWGRMWIHVLIFCGLCAACTPDHPSQELQWREAQSAFLTGEVGAYALWQAIDVDSPEGHEAQTRLSDSDIHYRRGVRHLERQEAGAREQLAAGVAIGPINPALYLRLGRTCAAQGLSLRAAEYFTKYLTTFPEGDNSDAARAELEELDPRLAGVFRSRPNPEFVVEADPIPWNALFAGLLLGVAITVLMGVLFRWQLGRGMRLVQLVEKSPEFHPSVAYLVGSLRHELLKHRIGAAADALQQAKPSERAFLQERLYGGQPLREAWEGHLLAFEGALGHRVDLRRDPWFRRADRAVSTIARLEDAVTEGSPKALQKLRKAHDVLMELDAHLAAMIGSLARTSVDLGLLHEIQDAVRSEHRAGEVELKSLDLVMEPAGTPDPDAPETEESSALEPLLVDVFRIDLVLILKNILRNAVLAVAGDSEPRVRLQVRVEVEDTGEETVRFEVYDTSEASFDPEMLFDRRVDRGLGLVAAAVNRYGGTIVVEAAEAPFAKRVVVSFFRAD